MSGENKKIAWIKEHLSYEFSMLEFAFKNLDGLEKRQIHWNVFFGSFFVNFRNIATFLKGVEKQNCNWKVSDFDSGFRLSQKELKIIEGLSSRLEGQIMHMGKLRGANAKQINIADVRKAHAWCERNLLIFINQLPSNYQIGWNEGQFDEATAQAAIRLGPEGLPSSSSHPSMHLSITASINPK